MKKIGFKLVLLAAVAAMAMQVTKASPAEIAITSGDCATGEFTLQLPAADRELMLYFAKAGEGDPMSEWSQWRNPRFVQTVPAGTTELSVTVPPFKMTDVFRFILADPARATITRAEYLIGGKNADGKFNSAFMTGLHPNWDWRYEVVFSVSEFGKGQSWLFCHRDSENNLNSLSLLAVRGVNGELNDKALRFGHGSTGDRTTTVEISADTVYQASIDGFTCVYTNVTADVEFGRVSTTAYFARYNLFNLCFGASVNGTVYNSNDGCSFAQVHSFKAWDGAGELKADYRPIVIESVAGYFDVVTKTFFRAGDGFPENIASTPYVASDKTLPVDTFVEHLGEPIAATPELISEFQCVSDGLPFACQGLPAYGNYGVEVGDSATVELPDGEFFWVDEASKAVFRVSPAGMRIDVYDATKKELVPGTPNRSLKRYTFTRSSAADRVRVVCLWNAEIMVGSAPDGRQAECLRLVTVGKDASGKTAVGDGPFNTGIHPIPATTRVLMEVCLSDDNPTDYSGQNNNSPYGERRFFGIRDKGDHGAGDSNWQYNFQICRNPAQVNTLRIDPCNYLDGVKVSGDLYVALTRRCRYCIDVNPTFVKIDGKIEGSASWPYEMSRLAELRDVSVQRSPEPLQGTLHIFGQMRDAATDSPKLCVDYDNTCYYRYLIWEDGETLTRDYVPCLDASGKPAFYDRVAGEYLYPIGDKAVYEADFGVNTGIGSVQVVGETTEGESAAYFSFDGTKLGNYALATGESKTFQASQSAVFNHRVVGYRIDTWTDGVGWVKGEFTKGTSVTLWHEESVRRLVWIWKKQQGLAIFFL